MTITAILAVIATIAGVDVLGGSFSEITAFGTIAGSAVATTLASAGAIVTGKAEDGGYWYTLDGTDILVYFA